MNITDLHPTGVGIAHEPRLGNIYVPFAFPGETPEVMLLGEARRGQWNARRLTAPGGICTVAGECGACTWPAAGYTDQLAWKEKLFRRAVAPIVPLADTAMEIHSNGGNTGFRSRVHLHANFYRGRLEFGFYAPGERRLIAIDDCPVARRSIRDVIRDLAQARHSEWQFPDFGFGIELTELETEGIVLLVLYSAPSRHEALRSALAQFAALPSGPRVELAFSGENPPYRWQQVEGVTMYTRAGCFQQVNRRQSDTIRSILARRLQAYQEPVVFDLYSGSGNYSLPLHAQAATLWGCDDNPVGIGIAHHNIAVNKIGNAHFTCADAAQLVADPAQYSWPSHADLVICDPARFGMAKGVAAATALVKPAEFILISNNTTAFIKDAKALLKSQFALQEIHLVDFFPNTPHWNIVSMWRL